MRTNTYTRKVDPQNIVVSDRLRDIDEDIVEALCAVGFRDDLHPIIVRPVKKRGQAKLHLVAGGHRHAAALRLGLKEITVIEKEMDDDEARLTEIEENMVRKDLKGLDRATFLAEWKRIYEQRNPEAKAGGDRKSKRNNSVLIFPFSEVAAEKLECSRSIVEKSVAMSERLSPTVKRLVAGTPLASNQSELFALSKHEPKRQLEILKLLLDGENDLKRVGQAAAKLEGRNTGPDKQSREAKVARAVDAWNRLDKRGEDMLLGHIGVERLYSFLNARTPKLEVAD